MLHVHAKLDYAASEEAGAVSAFRVVHLSDADGRNITDLVDPGVDYPNIEQLQEDLAAALGEPVEVEEVAINDHLAHPIHPQDEHPRHQARSVAPGTYESVCPDCAGTGIFHGAPCRTCEGTGWVTPIGH